MLSFSEVVNEAYYACSQKIAGWGDENGNYNTLPSDEMIAEDIINNYEGYEDEDNNPQRLDYFCQMIRIELDRQGLEYRTI